MAAGTPAATGERPRQLVEAVSSGNLDTRGGLDSPRAAARARSTRPREGFLAGMNEILMLGGILAIAGAVAALWLVRESDIERGELPWRPRCCEGEAGAGARGA